MQWRKARDRGRDPQRLKMFSLIAGLLLLAALATGFNVVVVQMQAAASAYVSGESIWSRAQVSTVQHLDRYAQSDDSAALAQAREWLEIPLGDLQARRAMEAAELDREAARDGLLQGRNHPDDIPNMIRLFRHFATAPYFREAVAVWRDSDPYILELASLADRLEAEWESSAPSPARLAALRVRLHEVDQALTPLSAAFRLAIADAARWLAQLLTAASVLFLLVLVLIAWLLTWRLTRALTAAERTFRATFEQAAVGMAQVDGKGHLLDVNQALCQILRYPRARLVGQRYPDLVHPDDQEIGRQEQRRINSGELDSYTIEHRLLCGDGDTVWGKLTVSKIRNDDDLGACHVAILEDVSEPRRLSAKLQHEANHDPLTGLYNRRAFERSVAEVLRQARTEESVHALCFVDLDQFKVVNDTAGHVAGDQFLRQIADTLHRQLREGDLLARLGGDEFAIILADCDLEGAREVTEKLRSAVANTRFHWEGASFNAGCSIGVVLVDAESLDPGHLLQAADIACYLAKEQGRNRVYLLRDNDQQLAERRGEMAWLSRLRAALHEQRLYLDTQRLVSLKRPASLRYEVLVRLLDEEGNTVLPAAFLPAAERFGMAHQIDRWVIEQVCRQLAAHPDHLAALEACHINLSGRSFDHEDFQDFVIGLLDRYALPAEKLCFEITETAAARNLLDVAAFMTRLGERGCSFALDDFGTGLSSFGYLRRLPVDCLKIDGTFVRNIANDETDLAMVRAINEIGRTLNKTVVAEYVETREALALLEEMGVDYVQGNGVHRPCRFEDLLTSRQPTLAAETPWPRS
ncbi:EAL domain-containing protein [Halomonas campisalis]|uniref:EAL domain-containing protein n=2 Tax=Billgrantia campisalis TaxID=74661 RepID=A0ABS9PC66_9GAMM|nr:EAL domain-containing protein [Halomonas campisalis]